MDSPCRCNNLLFSKHYDSLFQCPIGTCVHIELAKCSLTEQCNGGIPAEMLIPSAGSLADTAMSGELPPSVHNIRLPSFGADLPHSAEIFWLQASTFPKVWSQEFTRKTTHPLPPPDKALSYPGELCLRTDCKQSLSIVDTVSVQVLSWGACESSKLYSNMPRSELASIFDWTMDALVCWGRLVVIGRVD